MDGEINGQEAIENHLLFYKSLMTSNTDMERVSHYLELLKEQDDSKIKLDDPVDEGIRTVFRLVKDTDMDPWSIDIHEFVRLYSKKMNHNKFDIIVTGKLLVLAWDVVRLQSEATKAESELATRPLCDFGFDFSDELFESEREDLYIPDIVTGQSCGREATRPATMLEILDVFDEIGEDFRRAEEQELIDIELRKKRREERKKFNHRMDAELDEGDIDRIWNRIQKIGVGEFSIKELYTTSAKENITVFLSVLHLVYRGYLEVEQEDLLKGDIKLSIIVDSANTGIEQSQEIEVI